MTCFVVRKGASEANVVVTASDKVVFIVPMIRWPPHETSFGSNVVTFNSNVVWSGSNEAFSDSNEVSSIVEVITKAVNQP